MPENVFHHLRRRGTVVDSDEVCVDPFDAPGQLDQRDAGAAQRADDVTVVGVQDGDHDTVDLPGDHRVDDGPQRVGIFLRVGEEYLVSPGTGGVDRARRDLGVERIGDIGQNEADNPGLM